MKFPPISIRTKILLTTVSTTVIALVLICGTLVLNNNEQYLKAFKLVQELTIEADGTAGNTIDYVQDNDIDGITEELEMLTEHDSVEAAFFVTPNGDIEAKSIYDVKQKLRIPSKESLQESVATLAFQSFYYEMTRRHLNLYVPVRENDHLLGAIYIKADVKGEQGMQYILEILSLIIIIIILFSTRIQNTITSPITSLWEIMVRFSQENDFSVRATKKSNDEIGQLAEGFNEMLGQLESREKENKLGYERLQQTQAQLAQSSKLAAVGELAAGMAHEINNPIAFVSGNTRAMGKYMVSVKDLLKRYDALLAVVDNREEFDSLREELEKTKKRLNVAFMMEDIDDLIHDSEEGLDRITEIVAGLKNFARADQGEKTEVDLNKCLEQTIKVIWNEIKYKCTIKKEFGDIPEFKCNANQLNQVFMNLIVNAGHAIEEKGEIGIKTEFDAEKETVTISISDSGCGIPQENLDKLFDPFFTTKPVGIGTGLGLSISYGIIQKHGGLFEVDSVMGQGTTFRIVLPIDGKNTLTVHPNDVYKNAQIIQYDLKHLAEKLDIEIPLIEPRSAEDCQPVDVLHVVYDCLDRIVLLQKSVKMKLFDLPPFPAGDIAPAHVFQATSMIIAELGKIMQRLDLHFPLPELEEPQGKIPRDVYVQMGIVKDMLVVMTTNS